MQAQWWRAVHGRKAAALPLTPPSATQSTATQSTATQPAAGATAAGRSRADLDELIGEMRELRLTLASDLSAAAGAVDVGEDSVAADIIAGDRRELADFLRRSRARVDAEPSRTPARTEAAAGHRRRRVLMAIPAIPLAGALAASAAAAVGVFPTHHAAPHAATVAPAGAPLTSTFHQFVSVVDSDPSASQVVAAAAALHQQIAALIATAPSNDTGVREVAKLLQMEQALLMRKQPPGSAIVLAAARKLAAQLMRTAPHPVTSSTPRPSTATVPSPTPTTSSVHPTSSPTASANTWGSPAPAPSTAPSTSPTSSSSPSSSPSQGHIISFGN